MSNSEKVAIVTGAAQGIGRAIVLRLAEDGFNIVISDLSSQVESMKVVAEKAGEINKSGRFLTVSCDVSHEDQVQRLVDETVNHFGRLDCVRITVSTVSPGAITYLTLSIRWLPMLEF